MQQQQHYNGLKPLSLFKAQNNNFVFRIMRSLRSAILHRVLFIILTPRSLRLVYLNLNIEQQITFQNSHLPNLFLPSLSLQTPRTNDTFSTQKCWIGWNFKIESLRIISNPHPHRQTQDQNKITLPSTRHTLLQDFQKSDLGPLPFSTEAEDLCLILIQQITESLPRKMSSDYLKKPILAKKIESKCHSGLGFTSCEMQGWRRSMQDATICQEVADGVHLFGVFDGHGGPEVAHYVAQTLPKELLNQPYFKLKNYPKALANVFKRIDDMLLSNRGEEELTVISKRLGVTSAKGQKISYRAGTTAVVVLMTKDRYFVANIGDSRAVLSRAGTAVALSTDHKPDSPSEKNRIEKAGGYVQQGRVNGTLSLSRSFGDFEYKHFSSRPYEEQAVTSLPEITETERSPHDNFIIVGCDGVWERYVANSQKMVEHVQQLRGQQSDKKLVMDKLFNDLVAKDMKELTGCDNMSAILIELF